MVLVATRVHHRPRRTPPPPPSARTATPEPVAIRLGRTNDPASCPLRFSPRLLTSGRLHETAMQRIDPLPVFILADVWVYNCRTVDDQGQASESDGLIDCSPASRSDLAQTKRRATVWEFLERLMEELAPVAAGAPALVHKSPQMSQSQSPLGPTSERIGPHRLESRPFACRFPERQEDVSGSPGNMLRTGDSTRVLKKRSSKYNRPSVAQFASI